MSAFDPRDVSTWPPLLSLPQIAAIWSRPIHGIRRSIRNATFKPAPLEGKPYRFRKTDVERVVFGERGLLTLTKKASGY